MRKLIQTKRPLTFNFSNHQHAELYRKISDILHMNHTFSQLVLIDLTKNNVKNHFHLGRSGMTADQVLRAAIVKRIEGFTYEALAFHLSDSDALRTFMGYGFVVSAPCASTLHKNISMISCETWEKIFAGTLLFAKGIKMENGKKVRGDATVVDSHIARPCDSKLLLDSVRTLTRWMQKSVSLLPDRFDFIDHTRRAKRRFMAILNGKKEEQKKAYQDLLNISRNTLKRADMLRQALIRSALEYSHAAHLKQVEKYLETLTRFCDLTDQIISQAYRRIMQDKKVPACEKVASIFEDHTDIIVKSNRETLFGHKIDLFSGKSGLVVMCEVLRSNPADTSLVSPMMEAFHKIYGYYPEQTSFDGGFASLENLLKLKELGVKDVAFSKRRGMQIKDMCRSDWVYRKLRDFRAGIEAVISRLKRCFGLDRCDWKGFDRFQKYVLSAVVSYNLALIAHHLK